MGGPQNLPRQLQLRLAPVFRDYVTYWEASPMRKSRFTESQIVAVLQEGKAGVAVAELLRKRGISRLVP